MACESVRKLPVDLDIWKWRKWRGGEGQKRKGGERKGGGEGGRRGGEEEERPGRRRVGGR